MTKGAFSSANNEVEISSDLGYGYTVIADGTITGNVVAVDADVQTAVVHRLADEVLFKGEERLLLQHHYLVALSVFDEYLR